jgi:hypothetical protein
MIGLILFISVLFVKSILSLITVYLLFTRYVKELAIMRSIFGDTSFGLSAFFLYIFEIIAITILLYLSMD